MVQIRSSITLELEKNGQKITLDFSEAKQLIKSLSSFVNKVDNTGGSGNMITKRKRKEREATELSVAAAGSKRGTLMNTRRNIRRSKSSLKKKRGRKKKKILSMSETKRQEIIAHIYRQLSDKPKTLSALLEGVSYVPNLLPAIRQMVESKVEDINKQVIGKRIYYSRKSSFSSSSQSQTSQQASDSSTATSRGVAAA